MTDYLHSAIYSRRMRRFTQAEIPAGSPPRQPMLALCPSCGETYFAEQEPLRTHSQTMESWEALAKLDGECPDHPHRFAVGPFPERP